MQEKQNELICIETLVPEQFFTIENVCPVLEQIKSEVKKFVPDMSSVTGRKEIASMANKIARSKTALDDLGKNLVSKWKEQSKIVDNARKKIRDELDQLKEEVRKPLTDFENAEKEKQQKIEATVQKIENLAAISPLTSADANRILNELQEIIVDDSFGELKEVATVKRLNAIDSAKTKIEYLTKVEQERRELAELRLKQQEQERINREREIAEKAAERARIDAENRVRQEAEAKQKAVEEKARQEKLAMERENARLIQEKIRAEEKAKIAEEKIVNLNPSTPNLYCKKFEDIEKVTISKSEYDELKRRDKFLMYLEEAGVDNWDGFSYACEMMGKENV